jgi:hypothetical protein
MEAHAKVTSDDGDFQVKLSLFMRIPQQPSSFLAFVKHYILKK